MTNEGSGHEVIARSLKQTQEEKLRDVFLLIPVKKGQAEKTLSGAIVVAIWVAFASAFFEQ